MKGEKMEREKNARSLKEIAQRNMAIWLAALRTKNADEVADLYLENNTFLPTVSGKFRRGREEAKDYFRHFLEKNPDGKVIEDEVQPLGENVYVHSGMYKFVIDGDFRRESVPARFTYVWQKGEDGRWRILHHHSSLRPEGD